MIEATNITVSIGGRPILDAVDFRARHAEITAIVGPNGSGKTTLLKTLCGDYPYAGKAVLDGHDVRRLPPPKSAALRAVLPQSTTLSFPFTVREVVALGLTAGRPGVPIGQLRRLPEDALARVDLSGFAGRFYNELSGGEQQRVQLARVLCQVWLPVLEGVPRFLFLDEPVSSLDIQHQLLIMDVARQFAEAGGGVVAILHDLNLAAMYADSLLALKTGRVAASGPPASVLTDTLIETVFDCPIRVGVAPQTPFVLPQSREKAAGRTTMTKVA
ncbi:heme ABC transporter ATP-binding protein [Devosia nitrariae]|uniref:Hemin import ATP-binding protein HmuV n=1 Tax=Devosia nitrariae TaxID=2071872 RepID=A0ABQ5W467_9HYPH|nr:heme ABC transporter ATP-binding protein [Devosia nitrariae]GLQ54648.1 hemin import ATP-binding protein HmuV [Devosia nitrariae]